MTDRDVADMVIAIDGPAASGKGTLARRLADHLGRPHLDTGLLYRAVARRMLDAGLSLEDEAASARTAATLDPSDLDEANLRDARTGEAASIVSAHGEVRAALLAFQRRFAARPGGAVLDGRDIGTVVCPDADVKLFVTASATERARRRTRELGAIGGEEPALETVLADIQRRDARDASRETAPLKAAPDAYRLDTTNLDADAAFRAALAIVETARRQRVHA